MNADWLQQELSSIESNKPLSTDYPEPLKLLENKITEIVVDFSKPFEKKPNKMNSDTIQALIPVTIGNEKKIFWLSTKNPLYSQLVKAGATGQTKFKILRIGTQKNTRYSIVTD